MPAACEKEQKSPDSLPLWCNLQVRKTGPAGIEAHTHLPDRAIALFGNDEISHVPPGGIVYLLIEILTVDKEYHIGVIFQRTRLAQVRELRTFVLPDLD